jgi:hypothetical protein
VKCVCVKCVVKDDDDLRDDVRCVCVDIIYY